MSAGRRPSAMPSPRALALIASLLLAVAGLAAPARARADVLAVGDRAVELDVAVDEAGAPFKLAALKGGWYLVTIGAHWCEPCKKELPTWDRLAPEFAGRVTFVALNVSNKIADGKKFNAGLKLRHLKLAYLPQSKSGVVDRYGAEHMPSTFVVDPKGVVRLVRAGFEKGDADGELARLRDGLNKLLAK